MKTRVLLVEDHHDTRKLYDEILTLAGFQVCGAMNRSEAMARAGNIDVAVVDLGIPGGGYGLASALAETANAPALMVVTGRPKEEVDIIAPNLFARYLQKPVDSADLVSCVRALAEGRPRSAPGV